MTPATSTVPAERTWSLRAWSCGLGLCGLDRFAGRSPLLLNDFARGLVLPQALEGSVADDLVGRPAAEFHLADELAARPRRRPAAGRRVELCCEGRLFCGQGLKLLGEIAREFGREPGSGPAGIDQPISLEVAEDQRSDRLLDRRRGHEAGDDEFLALGAFGLDPVAVAAGSVGEVATLRDDAFEPEPAGVAEHGRAIRRPGAR